MSVTLQQIKADIRTGKSKAIYFCDGGSLWWTHLESDLKEATEQGITYRKEIARRNGSGLVALTDRDTDPLGHIVKVFAPPGQFLNRSISNPGHFGKYGLRAFLKAHHQNCNNYFSNTWAGYNNLIEREK